MDPQRTGESLDLDRELAALLSVEPSVEFAARVRMRIAAEPEPSLWRRPWLIAAASACAVLITVTMAATRTNVPMSGLFADISLWVPAIVPGPLAAMTSGLRRERPTPEMQAIMRSNAEASQMVATHLANRDYAAIGADAETLGRNFFYLERFWEGKQVDEATRLSRNGSNVAAELRAAALSGDAAAIATAVAAMTAVCNACHARYREALPDNTYAIKL